jgi:hypothetical protein
MNVAVLSTALRPALRGSLPESCVGQVPHFRRDKLLMNALEDLIPAPDAPLVERIDEDLADHVK